MKILKNFDIVLFLTMILLSSFGLMVLFSTSFNTARDQLIFLGLGLIIYFYFATVDFRIFKPFGLYLYLFNLVLLIVTFIFGIYSKGAIRWIPLGISGFTLQPSEFMKLGLIIFLSAYFSSSYWNSGIKAFITSIFITAVPAFLIFIQPDLGTAIVVASVWAVLIVASRTKSSNIIVLILLIAIVSPVLVSTLKPYQKQRIETFLNPSSDPLGAGYHVLQSEIAIGSGGILGRGFGRGTQSHLRFLPEFHTDFIFASLSEEWGFVGSLIVLVLYILLLIRIISIGLLCPYSFGQLICLGVFAMIFTQVFVNIGMNVGVAPITGIPLPLISSGGSSLFLTVSSLGLVQSVARYSKKV